MLKDDGDNNMHSGKTLRSATLDELQWVFHSLLTTVTTSFAYETIAIIMYSWLLQWENPMHSDLVTEFSCIHMICKL